MNCPSCSQAMIVETFPHRMHGEVQLDICYPCNAIWFDQMESTQLAPGGVIELFKKIHAHDAEGHRPFSTRLACTRCRKPLAEVNDLARTGRFTYHRCPEGHGRLTSFFHFLREKQFVRNLTPKELSQLKATVKQVRCSSCGGPVDLTKDAACGYCRAPISILDADAVERTLSDLHAKEQGRGKVDIGRLDELAVEEQKRRRQLARMSGADQGHAGAWKDTSATAVDALDLVTDAISAIYKLID